MNSCLVPANAKKSMLIFGFLRPMPDLLILGVGVGITVLLFLIGSSSELWYTIISCLPAFVCISLILPIPNYHNVLVAIGSLISFYTNRRCYVWKGWCLKDEFK